MIKKQVLRRKIREIFRHSIDVENRLRLKNKDFTIISSNCIGGIIYHDLKMPFLSPTINLYMNTKDFIKFCSNMKYYLDQELIEVLDKEYNYPVAKCVDLKLYGVHYRNFHELNDKWHERAGRINWNNIYVMLAERDDCGINDIKQFDKLEIKNKVIFVHQEMPHIKSAVYIPGSLDDEGERTCVADLTTYKGRFTGERLIDKFDYVEFFNSGLLKLR